MDAVAEEPITLSPETRAAIRRHVKSGHFPDPEAVVLAALFALEKEVEQLDEFAAGFAPGELIAKAERSGKRDGPTALAEFDAWRRQQLAARSAPAAVGS